MTEPRISKVTGAFMISVAVFFDLISAGINLIPIAGQILGYLITLFGYLTHWLWFSLKGVSIINPKKAMKTAVRFLGPAVLEVITAGIAPGLTISVLLTIGQSRLEDHPIIAKTKKIQEEQGEFEEDYIPQSESYDEDTDRDTL